ncbi:MAG: hypothetical protein JWQ02_1241 [Capsulimonas sp.]|nr:hypothetical protein [Capsulimonas sp.]
MTTQTTITPDISNFTEEARVDPSALLKQAQGLLRAGDAAAAEPMFRAALAQLPDSWAAVNGLLKILDARGARAEAADLLNAFVALSPTHSSIMSAARQWEAWDADPPPARRGTLRIALTGTGTLNSLASHLRVACAGAGLHAPAYVSDFNQWAQDLLPPQSPLYDFQPDLIAISIGTAELFPRTVSDSEATAEEIAAERTAGVNQIAELLAASARSAPSATVVLHTFSVPDYSPFGILDAKTIGGQRDRIQAINARIVELVNERFPRTALLDQERVEARHGKDRVRDDRMWYMASMPFSDTFLPVIASEYLRIVKALKGLGRKCVVLDLDNTLWGGVIGEDGINNIKIGGQAAPGNAFRDFQRALLALRGRGIILAVCSKNNPDDVWPVFENHPDMVLRREHFAAVRINWSDKATNIAEIARELNIGLDSLVFLDDNPAERGLVRQQLPDVLTVELPKDPAFYTRTLLGLDVFDVLSLTEEDRKRAQQYQEQAERRQLEETATAKGGDVTAYLRSLEIVAALSPATPFTVPRIAQLINKTNQFNMTTRRYTEQQVAAMSEDTAGWGVYSCTVLDRFGDSGLTGVALVRKGVDVWEIDSFLLSCRVLGRGVEDALLTYLLSEATSAGASTMRGLFAPTAKNAPAAGFYDKQGWTPSGVIAGDENVSAWEIAVNSDANAYAYPEWLTISRA